MVLKELKLNCVTISNNNNTTANSESTNLDITTDITTNGTELTVSKLNLLVNYAELNAAHKSFLKEAQVLRNLNHPNIIKLIGIYYDDSLSLVMELAKFGQLRTYLQANKNQIDISTLIAYCYQLSKAMSYLENKKYVHRYIIYI